MRKFILISLLCFGLFIIIGAQDNRIEQASNAYQVGDFSSAIQIYEDLLAGGFQNGELFYNLGNAYYAQENIGEALLNYRRAQLFLPRDLDISIQIARIRAQRLDAQPDETDIFNSLIGSTETLVTLNELGWLVIGVWWGWGLICILYRVVERWRFMMRYVLGLTTLLLLAGFLLFGSRFAGEILRPSAVLIVEEVDVRTGPGESYFVPFQIFEAIEMRVIEVREQWVRFQLPDGRQGWIPQDRIGYVQRWG